MKSKFTKITSFLLASGIVASTVVSSAANFDYYHEESDFKEIKYRRQQILADGLAKRHTIAKPEEFMQEFDGYLYEQEYTEELYKKHGSAWTDHLEKSKGIPLKKEGQEGELEVKSISAITDTTLVLGQEHELKPVALDEEGKELTGAEFAFASADEDVVAVDENGILTAKKVGEAEVTVSVTNAAKEVEKTILVTVKDKSEVKDFELELNVLTAPDKLIADGQTTMELEVELKGPNANEVSGMIEFKSKQGLKANHVETALDKGKAKLSVKLPTSPKDLEDEFYVVIKTHDPVKGLQDENNGLKGLQSVAVNRTYLAADTVAGGEEHIQRRYPLDRVTSTDMADRVVVYVGGVREADADKVGQAIIDQVRVANSIDETKDIKLVKEVSREKLKSGYAYTMLLELPEEDDDSTDKLLHDNQYNYYRVKKLENEADKEIIITGDEDEKYKVNRRFSLVDGKAPRVSRVEAHKEGTEDLPRNTILVEYSEPVNRTAEKIENYTINGRKLKEEHVKEIKLLDFNSKDIPAAVKEGRERNTVLIQLTLTGRNQLLDNGSNLLLVKNVADWAGSTDLSDNNKITSQEFKFDYEKPEVEVGIELKKESPEQYIITLNDELYKDEKAATKFDITKNLAVRLYDKDKVTEKDPGTIYKLKAGDYNIEELEGTDDQYLLELTKDWTILLKDGIAYHNQYFEVSLTGKAYDANGDLVLDTESDEKKEIKKDIEVPEDTKSPTVLGEPEFLLTDEDYEEATQEDNEEEVGYKVRGAAKVTMSEPVQLTNGDEDEENTTSKPNLTPSKEQLANADENSVDGIPVTSLEYVKVRDTDGKISKGVRVKGKIQEGSINQRDTEFISVPTEELSAGDWKLVIRQITDDVGNAMATEEFAFTIEEDEEVIKEVQVVNPYVVWAYAVDNEECEGGCSGNDYVRILYSRKMNSDAISLSAYGLNGKEFGQDVDITREYVNMFEIEGSDGELHGKSKSNEGNVDEWIGTLVTIKLPKDFINQDKDTNALTIKDSVKAVADKTADGKEIEKTSEELQYDNNFGDKLIELNFNLDGEANEGLLPEIAKSAEDEFDGVVHNGKENKENFINNICPAGEDDEPEDDEPEDELEEAKQELTDAIEKAKEIVEKKDATEDELKEAKDALEKAIKEAKEIFNNEDKLDKELKDAKDTLDSILEKINDTGGDVEPPVEDQEETEGEND